jgi:hypothetical protein
MKLKVTFVATMDELDLIHCGKAKTLKEAAQLRQHEFDEGLISAGWLFDSCDRDVSVKIEAMEE